MKMKSKKARLQLLLREAMAQMGQNLTPKEIKELKDAYCKHLVEMIDKFFCSVE